MQLVASIVAILVFAGTALAQDQEKEITKADDPLIKLTSEIVDKAFENGKDGIKDYLYVRDRVPESEREATVQRLVLIARFADGFHFITKTRAAEPLNPWAMVTKSDFKIVRLVDEGGKAKDQVVVRFNVPEALVVTSHLDRQRYNRVEWKLLFREKDGKFLIETVEQSFKNTVMSRPAWAETFR